jgi:hypothetical protein
LGKGPWYSLGGSQRQSEQDGKQNKKYWEELIAYFSCYYTAHVENDASDTSSIVVCVFVAMSIFLQSHCLATRGGFSPSQWLGMRDLRNTLEMGSGAMIYMSCFIKTGSAIQKLIGVDTKTHRQLGDRIRLLPFFFFKIWKIG